MSDGDPIEIGPRRAAELLAEGATVVDVRERYEREAGHIAGSRHIELGRLAAAAGELDRDLPLVFYCRVGARSAMAADAFRNAGFAAHTLGGGLLAWVDAGLPLEPEGGSVAPH
jgi:rhodanese-related sulfurtransferase